MRSYIKMIEMLNEIKNEHKSECEIFGESRAA